MKRIRVRIVDSKRDGIVFKWVDAGGASRQQSYSGRSTTNAILAAKLDLEEELNRTGQALTWPVFVERCNRSYISRLEPRAQEKPRTMLRRLGAEMESRRLHNGPCAAITEEVVMTIEESLEESGLATATIRSNMATLWAILSWGADSNLLPRLHKPRRRHRKRDATESHAKGRALSMEEIERMIHAIEKNPVIRPELKPANQRVRKADESATSVIRAIQAMRLLGLRLDDCHMLNWEPVVGAHYPSNIHSHSPMLVFASAQKSGREEKVPLSPMAAEWFRSIARQSGWVCRLTGQQGEHQTTNRLGRIIANAGRAAGVIVKPNGGRNGQPKYGSAHDLRRTFARFMLNHLPVRDVQKLTRHASFETLLRYYSDPSDGELSAKLKTIFRDSGGYLVDDKNGVSLETP